MAKKTTRIVVEIGAELKRVLTIYEKPSGGLTLVIPSKTYGSLRGKQVPIEEHRYSIHLAKTAALALTRFTAPPSSVGAKKSMFIC